MTVYRVQGLSAGERERAVAAAVRGTVGTDVTVDTDPAAGTVSVSPGADPQLVIFAIEGAGCPVTSVEHPDGDPVAARH